MKCIFYFLLFISVSAAAQNFSKSEMYESMARTGDVYIGKKLSDFQGVSNDSIIFNKASIEGKVTFCEYLVQELSSLYC